MNRYTQNYSNTLCTMNEIFLICLQCTNYSEINTKHSDVQKHTYYNKFYHFFLKIIADRVAQNTLDEFCAMTRNSLKCEPILGGKDNRRITKV